VGRFLPVFFTAFGPPIRSLFLLLSFLFRMESPRISMRWALFTKRSRIPFGQLKTF
jgi:hypothetical protein